MPESPENTCLSSESENDGEELALISTSEDLEDTKECVSTRSIMALMGFLGFANVYAMRVNLSVAIVAMVNNTRVNNTTYTDVCSVPFNNVTNSTLPPAMNGEFDWDESTQSKILGAFFYGYVLTQVPGGRLAELYGGKLVFGLGVLITGIFTALSPLAARLNIYVFVAVRVIEGLGEGVTFPAMMVMLARWIPPIERSKFASYVYAGALFGSVVSLPLSGYLCSLTFLGGWPLSFYLFGLLSTLWFIAWLFLVYDEPSCHPRISEVEKAFIIESIGRPIETGSGRVPWCKILTSVPMWAVLVTQCGQSWAFYTQLTEMPTYMQNILHFTIEENALLSALPYLTTWWFGIALSHIAYHLLKREWISELNCFKLFNTIASVIPSMGLVWIAWLGCDRLSIPAVLAITAGFSGASYAGNQMNHVALSPRFAGTMYGLTNAASNTCGFLAPYAVGLLINGKETLTQWHIVFYIAAVVNVIGCLFYVAFASAKEQPFNVSSNSMISKKREHTSINS